MDYKPLGKLMQILKAVEKRDKLDRKITLVTRSCLTLFFQLENSYFTITTYCGKFLKRW